jgi:NAD(P)-dependent dehydrogenase (short-subunit alcohol dehydrogenase family)
MSLQNKTIMIFAGSGAISRSVARVALRAGAKVVLSAKTPEATAAAVDQVSEGSRDVAGRLLGLPADALAPKQVREALDSVLAKFGRLDAVFNGIGGRPAELGYPAASVETSLEDFMRPMQRIVASQFLTAREAASRMKPGGSIVLLSATLSGMTARHMAGISAACGAVEALTRALAGDFGAAGLRVNCVRGSAMPETRTIQETFQGLSTLGAAPQMTPPPLGRPISVEETANAALFLASDAAGGMTGQIVTVCGGAFV